MLGTGVGEVRNTVLIEVDEPGVEAREVRSVGLAHTVAITVEGKRESAPMEQCVFSASVSDHI